MTIHRAAGYLPPEFVERHSDSFLRNYPFKKPRGYGTIVGMKAHSKGQTGKRVLLIFLILLLSGCSLEYGDGLLSLPKLPGEYLLLQHEIDAILSTGAVYATAETGGNRQAVQLVDMDGDGEDEAIAFFRMPGGDFLVCAYQRTADGYEEIGRAEGFGSSIHAVHYPCVSADGHLALALSWGLEDASTYGMTVFDITDEGLESVLDIQYSSLLVEDMNGDSVDELCFAVRDAVTGGHSLHLYNYSGGGYRLMGETPLSVEVRSVSLMQFGVTRGGHSAVFVDSAATGGGYITDVVSLSSGVAVNETIDMVAGSGAVTWRLVSVSSTDIDGDGIIDVPVAAEPQSGSETQQSDARYKLHWFDFAQGEEPQAVATTYHSVAEEWYLMWPDIWGEAVTASRRSFSGVSRTTFSVSADRMPAEKSSRSLLTICVYTGDNRVSYAVADGVKIIRQTASSIYGYILPENAPIGYALTDEQVAEIFKLMERDWTAGG